MKRFFLLYAVLIFLSNFLYVNIASAQDFKNVKFDEVMIYEFIPSVDKTANDVKDRIDIIGTTLDSVTFKKSAFLTKQESEKFYKYLIAKSSFTGSSSICWEPRLGIYFLKNKKIVNQVEVCMNCNKLVSLLNNNPSEPTTDKEVLYVSYPGMSSSFRKFIESLLVKYSFENKL